VSAILDTEPAATIFHASYVRGDIMIHPFPTS